MEFVLYVQIHMFLKWFACMRLKFFGYMKVRLWDYFPKLNQVSRYFDEIDCYRIGWPKRWLWRWFHRIQWFWSAPYFTEESLCPSICSASNRLWLPVDLASGVTVVKPEREKRETISLHVWAFICAGVLSSQTLYSTSHFSLQPFFSFFSWSRDVYHVTFFSWDLAACCENRVNHDAIQSGCIAKVCQMLSWWT